LLYKVILGEEQMAEQKRFSNIIGFDDAPFSPGYVGQVKVVGAVFTGLQLSGVVIGEVEKDGLDAAERLAALVAESRFYEHVQLVMLQGITLAGFNVVDVFYLHQQLGLPILVVSRRLPDMGAIQEALRTRIPEGARRWALIEQLGPPEPAGKVYVQRVGLSMAEATAVVERFAICSYIPEPLRVAHLIAGAVGEGHSRGRV
jgi:endonuclease V-like protein UPF0215 family